MTDWAKLIAAAAEEETAESLEVAQRKWGPHLAAKAIRTPGGTYILPAAPDKWMWGEQEAETGAEITHAIEDYIAEQSRDLELVTGPGRTLYVPVVTVTVTLEQAKVQTFPCGERIAGNTGHPAIGECYYCGIALDHRARNKGGR